MSIKELLRASLRIFPIVLSGSAISLSLYAVIFDIYGFYTFQIVTLIPMSVVSALTMLVFYSKRELSKVQLRVRYFFQAVLVAGIVVAFLNSVDMVRWYNLPSVILILASVGAIFLVSHIVGAILNASEAKKLTSGLQEYNENI